MKTLLICSLAAGALLCACAAPETVSSTEAATLRDTPSEREYPTGSNIPRKTRAPADTNIPLGLGVRVHSREDLERMQNSGHGAPQRGSGQAP